MNHYKRNLLVIIAFICLSTNALGFNFKLNDAEWALWPGYCKTRYLDTSVGRISKYSNLYSQQAIKRMHKKWIKTIGPTYDHIHHYCAGLIQSFRARGALDSKQEMHHYKTAIGSINYTYEQSGPSCPLYSQMSAVLAKAYVGAGQTWEAIRVLHKAIKLQPNKPQAYIQLAKIYGNQDKNEEALTVLKTGVSNVGDKSRLLHVYLARTYIKKKELELAKQHVIKAYKLGYRSPKLKQQLRKLENSAQ